jgi:hypothetical protein
MANKQKSNWNLEQLSDTEIYASIRDLDPGPASPNEQDPKAWSSNAAELMVEGFACLHTAALVIWFSLVILLAFVWFLLARNAFL